MTVTALQAEGEFRIGSVLSRAWNVLFANFPFFFLVAVVTALPGAVWPLVVDPTKHLVANVLVTVVSIVLGTIGQAVILVGAFQYLRGEPVQAGEAFRQAMARFLPLVGLGILYGLGVGIGFVLLIVPGLILLARWAVVIPACLVEGTSPTDSMSRSASLTEGNRWKVLGVLLLTIIVFLIVYSIFHLALNPAGIYATQIGTLLLQGVWGAFFNCLAIMIYHDLRMAKEGISSKQIVAVFD